MTNELKQNDIRHNESSSQEGRKNSYATRKNTRVNSSKIGEEKGKPTTKRVNNTKKLETQKEAFQKSTSTGYNR